MSTDPQDPAAISAAAVAQAALFIPYNGSILIAIDTTWLLFGCLLIQLYHYYSFKSSGDIWLRYIAAASAIACGLHVGFGTATQWGILVEHWGDPLIWASTPWSSALGPFTSGLSGVITQVFFVGRIVILSKTVLARIAASVILLASLLAFSASIAIMILFLKGGKDAFHVSSMIAILRLWTITTTLCDVLIAATMSTILSIARSRTSFPAMRNLLVRLILQTIETGTVTAVVMVLCTISNEVITSNSSYMVWEFASGPLYGNVLLFVLNSRQHNRKFHSDFHTFSDMTSSGSRSRNVTATDLSSKNQHSITVTTDVLTQYDANRTRSLYYEQ